MTCASTSRLLLITALGAPISSMPTASGYEKDGLSLGVRYAGAGRGDLPTIEDWHRRRGGGVFESFRSPRPLDLRAVLRRSRDARYLVLLAVEADYHDR